MGVKEEKRRLGETSRALPHLRFLPSRTATLVYPELVEGAAVGKHSDTHPSPAESARQLGFKMSL